jgi:hypothetical protein
MASYNPNSGLQVAPDAKQYAPPHSTASQPYYAPQNGMGPQYYPQQTGGVHAEKTICGVRRPTFWLSFALIFVIISAGIGAGVGGGLAVQNVKKAW